MAVITQAFVLGAGLGTRLRPLTDEVPKPLVPIFQKRLITFAFDHLIDADCTKLVVNTHHRPEVYEDLMAATYRGVPVNYRHEPVLLETGGGIANVQDLLGREPFLVYNGDILSDLPIAPLLAAHENSGNVVTLALRSGGGPQHVAFDRMAGKLVDIRNQLGTGARDEFVFTGIYVAQPEFVEMLAPGVKRSVIPTFLELIRKEKLGGAVIDDGHWWDVGTRAAYLDLHRQLPRLNFPQYPVDDPDWRARIHPSAEVHATAQLGGVSVIGAGATIGSGAHLEDTIVWPGAQITSRSRLRNCIVRSHSIADGDFSDLDL